MAERSTGTYHAVLAGGGTGGHVFPALAVARELEHRGWQVTYMGTAGGPEARLAAAAGLEFQPIAAGPIVGQGLGGRLRSMVTLGRSALATRRQLRQLEADAVFGTGGYVSAPVVLGARLARKPVMLFEPNANVGLANRWLSRWASEAAVTWESTGEQLACPAVVTGTPVRAAFFETRDARAQTPLRLLVLGGSQGARQLNLGLPAALELAAPRLGAVEVLHQTGREKLDETRDAYAERRLGQVSVEVVPFLDDVAGALAASHLVVSRAGAVTLAELCAVGRAAVLVPLAHAGAHQLDNANLVAESGGAEVLFGDEVTPERLGGLLVELLTDGQRLESMGRALAALARPDAAAVIADRLGGLAEGS